MLISIWHTGKLRPGNLDGPRQNRNSGTLNPSETLVGPYKTKKHEPKTQVEQQKNWKIGTQDINGTLVGP